MAYKCPRCGHPVQRGFSSGAATAGGMAGMLFHAAFGAFVCKSCWKISRGEFPAEDRTKMVVGSSVLVLVAIALVIGVIWLIAALN